MKNKKNALVVAFDVVVDSQFIADMGFSGCQDIKEDLFGVVVDVQGTIVNVQTERGCFSVPINNIVLLAEDVPGECQNEPLAAFGQLLPQIIKTILRRSWAMEQIHKSSNI